MILYTSGSTGTPKGVPLTHAGQLWASEYRLKATPDIERQRLLVAAPLYHMNALWISTAFALPGRATVVLLPRFSAPAYIDAIGRYRCTWLTSVPTMMAFELQILGSNGWTPDDLVTLLQMVEARRLVPVIDRVLPLAEAREGIRLIGEREVIGKVVVVP